MGETAQEQEPYMAHGEEAAAIPPQAVLKRRSKRYLLLLSLGVLVVGGAWFAYHHFIGVFTKPQMTPM